MVTKKKKSIQILSRKTLKYQTVITVLYGKNTVSVEYNNQQIVLPLKKMYGFASVVMSVINHLAEQGELTDSKGIKVKPKKQWKL